jgi:hypothetical protein
MLTFAFFQQQVVRELGGPDGGKIEKKRNNVNYPDSVYENLKAGFKGEEA